MKTKEELNALKDEVESLNKKLSELTEEELVQVSGGANGSAKLFNEEKGFGFIQPDGGGCDTYVHHSQVEAHPPATPAFFQPEK